MEIYSLAPWLLALLVTIIIVLIRKGSGHLILTAIASFFIFFVIFFGGIYLFIAQPYKNLGVHMVPALNPNTTFIGNKISYRFSKPQRGDIVVFFSSQTDSSGYKLENVQRIIGLPGEEIKIAGGQVYINNTVLTEPYLTSGTKTLGGNFIKDGTSIQIPANEYFLMGDNRANSDDSRELGFTKREDILAKYWTQN